MKKIIVTGISGFLGQHFADAPAAGWEIHGIHHQQPFREGSDHFWEIDLTDIEYTKTFFDQIKPKAIIHLAAISKPSECEADPDYSYKVNVVIPALLAQYAYAKRIHFYYISTDMVFDGTKGPYDYQGNPAPVNLYGKQKYEAERRIMDIHSAATIIRLPLLYGYTPKKQNFLTEWVDKLQQGEEFIAFTDEYRSPVYVKDAVEGILFLVKKRHQGIWHLGGPDRLSRYEMAIQIAEAIGADTDLVIGKKLSEIELPYPRPADVSLICRKTEAAGLHPRTFAEGLKAALKDYDV